MAAAGGLRARLAELRRREADLLTVLRAEEHGADGAAPAVPAAPAGRPCTSRMQDVALRLFALTDMDFEAPLKFLSMRGRPASESDVRQWYRAVPPDRRAGLLIAAPGDSLAERRLAEARKFLSERRLVSWVREQNSSKGVAPTSSLIIEHAEPGLLRSKLQKNKMRWVRKCMQRWGGRRASLGRGDGLSQQDFRQKASLAVLS
jgi:hypothetical protein